MTDDATRLDADEMLAEACRRTGLHDFGDPSFEEPMRRLVDSMEREGRLHAIGRATQRERVIGLLVNRLRCEAAFTRHPEIDEEEIAAPVVIVGLARTGTTMLQRMLAAHPHFLALRWWESRHPAPFGSGDPGAQTEGDPRIAAAEEEVRAICEAAPELVAAHPLDAHAPDEEIMLLEHSFFSNNSEAYVQVPSFGSWLDAQDQRPGYRYLKRLLKLVQWQKSRRGESGRRWVLKTPNHLGHLDLLFEVFPDARVVQTHRDPVQTIPSLASLVYTILATGSDEIDPVEVGRQWCERMRSALESCMDYRDAHRGAHRDAHRDAQPGPFLDLDYRDLVADPMASARRICEFVGEQFDAEAETRMREWAQENARDRRPVHSYTLERFGLTEEGLARDFARYRSRFL